MGWPWGKISKKELEDREYRQMREDDPVTETDQNIYKYNFGTHGESEHPHPLGTSYIDTPYSRYMPVENLGQGGYGTARTFETTTQRRLVIKRYWEPEREVRPNNPGYEKRIWDIINPDAARLFSDTHGNLRLMIPYYGNMDTVSQVCTCGKIDEFTALSILSWFMKGARIIYAEKQVLYMDMHFGNLLISVNEAGEIKDAKFIDWGGAVTTSINFTGLKEYLKECARNFIYFLSKLTFYNNEKILNRLMITTAMFHINSINDYDRLYSNCIEVLDKVLSRNNVPPVRMPEFSVLNIRPELRCRYEDIAKQPRIFPEYIIPAHSTSEENRTNITFGDFEDFVMTVEWALSPSCKIIVPKKIIFSAIGEFCEDNRGKRPSYALQKDLFLSVIHTALIFRGIPRPYARTTSGMAVVEYINRHPRFKVLFDNILREYDPSAQLQPNVSYNDLVKIAAYNKPSHKVKHGKYRSAIGHGDTEEYLKPYLWDHGLELK